MKKISLKTFRKSFHLSKSKDDGDFMVVPAPPALPVDFGAKDEPLFGVSGSGYGKELAGCSEDEKGAKGRPKGEGLMGTLKRRLSAKQKAKAKGVGGGGGCGGGTEDDDVSDTFSSSSAPLGFKETRAPRPLRSTSLRGHHYSPTPWPLRPSSSEETCIRVEVRVKALVHSAGPGLGPPLNGLRKDLTDLQQPEAVGGSSSGPKSPGGGAPGELRLPVPVPVVLGLVPRDYLPYAVPLDACCLDAASPMEVSAALPQPGPGDPFPDDEAPMEPDALMLGPSPELFVDPAGSSLLMGPVAAPRGRDPDPERDAPGGEDSAPLLPPPLSPLLPPLQPHALRRHLGGLAGPDGGRCPWPFDPGSAPGVVARACDSGPAALSSLTEELKQLARQGWYWGPITRWEAEAKLGRAPDGAFLVRDSSDDRYLLSLSFRSHGKTLHTRIEHSNGRFSFYEQPDVEGHTSIVELIEHSVRDSENGAFCYSRSRLPGSATYPVRLTHPVSRFMQVRSLQYLCRFVIRQYTRIDLIQKLPLPNKMKDYLQEKHY